MTGIERSSPYEVFEDDDGGGGVSQDESKIESQALDLSQPRGLERSVSVSSADSPARKSIKRALDIPAEKHFAGLSVVDHDGTADMVANNDVVYVEENGKTMWTFAPVWDEAMVDFVTQLTGVTYNKAKKKINGFVGIVRKLEVQDHDMLTFRLYWKNEKTAGWEWYPYTVARKMVHRIGRIQQDDVDKVDSVTATAQESQSLGFAPSYIKQLRF